MIYYKKINAEGTESKGLEAGRSIEIFIRNSSQVFTGIIEFIGVYQGATHIFVDIGPEKKALLKISQSRTIKEMVLWTKTDLTVNIISNITVTHMAKQYAVDLFPKIPTYSVPASGTWNVPVEVGDMFIKKCEPYTVLAVARNGTLFLEDNDGQALQLTLKDEGLAYCFQGLYKGNID
ncbi:hypothetical protein AVV36_gp106 [Pectobacterium bacteriophage PM2]|uniref:Uncharacterized protein n=1 Tax=Pectobacterium bacteriophage PM2 TaxID=1429794 RepID=A0A0A0Q0M4_9CAUD|nr:hypothetical protein AVV36_gp106 [Pectobacterium bacteriophage PM2]AHY25068.1 hypothetical protein PM2_106 [Pectobacterium bacteriophage PM2]